MKKVNGNENGKVMNLEVGVGANIETVAEVVDIPSPAEAENTNIEGVAAENNETIETPVAAEAVVNTETIAPAEASVNEDGQYDVSELVKTGPRGVTNQGMIPALKEYISKGETANIITLRKCFPEVVDSSLKYLGKKEQKKFVALVG